MSQTPPIPEAFVKRIHAQFATEGEAILAAMSQEPTASVRLNAHKTGTDYDHAEIVPWCTFGRILNERPSFITDPMWHAGAYYVQESSSQFLYHVVKWLREQCKNPIKVLDLCAAPGGKTTLISQAIQPGDLLIANEAIKSRVGLLTENCTRWGMPNLIVVNNQPSEFSKLTHEADIMLIDAPCSGEGMFRKTWHAREEWSESLVDLCAARQSAMLQHTEQVLKPEGYLIYATCTFNTAENEQQLIPLLDKGYVSVPIPIQGEWPIHYTKSFEGHKLHMYRFMPHQTQGEGLCVSVLQKPEGVLYTPPIKRRNILKPVACDLEKWLQHPKEYVPFLHKGEITAWPNMWVDDLARLRETLNTVQIGIHVGTQAGQDFIPAHSLALSYARNTTIPSAELSKEQALAYLRKQTPDPILFSQSGWQLVTYRNQALGWVKVLANRVNNYLPTSWRILKS